MPRRLGQHFLKPASVARLVALIDPRRDEAFLEIGPGQGALTLPLASRAAEVTAVELDAALVARLQPALPANVHLVAGDALEIDLRELVREGTRLVGNLPYYISSPLLRRFLDLRRRGVRDLHVMLQEEVARRIAAPPGSKDYGVLSVMYGVWADLDVPLVFEAGAFSPPPRVRSAVLRGRFRPPPFDPPEPAALENLLHKAFARRRRTLENNLQDSYANLKENLRLLHIEGSRRAETLSVEEFAALARALEPLPPRS